MNTSNSVEELLSAVLMRVHSTTRQLTPTKQSINATYNFVRDNNAHNVSQSVDLLANRPQSLTPIRSDNWT